MNHRCLCRGGRSKQADKPGCERGTQVIRRKQPQGPGIRLHCVSPQVAQELWSFWPLEYPFLSPTTRIRNGNITQSQEPDWLALLWEEDTSWLCPTWDSFCRNHVPPCLSREQGSGVMGRGPTVIRSHREAPMVPNPLWSSKVELFPQKADSPLRVISAPPGLPALLGVGGSYRQVGSRGKEVGGWL